MTTGKLATLDAKSTPQLFQASQFTGVQSSATLLAAVADGFYRIFLVDINSAATTGIVTLTFAGAAQPVARIDLSAGSTWMAMTRTKQDGAVNTALQVSCPANTYVHIGYSLLSSPSLD